MSEHDALPAWAPASLVEKYQRVRIDESGGDSNDWPTGLPHAQVEAVLRRLLTREDMRAAWATLERAPMNPRLQRRHFEGPTIPDRYWIEIAFALRDFASLPKFTSKEKTRTASKDCSTSPRLNPSNRRQPVRDRGPTASAAKSRVKPAHEAPNRGLRRLAVFAMDE